MAIRRPQRPPGVVQGAQRGRAFCTVEHAWQEDMDIRGNRLAPSTDRILNPSLSLDGIASGGIKRVRLICAVDRSSTPVRKFAHIVEIDAVASGLSDGADNRRSRFCKY